MHIDDEALYSQSNFGEGFVTLGAGHNNFTKNIVKI
jgi:hypothetical protein